MTKQIWWNDKLKKYEITPELQEKFKEAKNKREKNKQLFDRVKSYPR